MEVDYFYIVCIRCIFDYYMIVWTADNSDGYLGQFFFLMHEIKA